MAGAERSPELSWVPELSLVPASAVPQSVTADSLVSGTCASPPVFTCVCGEASPAFSADWDDSLPGCAPDEPPAPHPDQTAAIISVKMSIKITADFLNTVKPPLLLK